MKRMLAMIVMAGLAGAACADAGMKPGLWEMHIGKTVVDGRDTSAQMASMNEQMQQQMAKLTPEQRAQMAAMLGQQGMGMAAGGGLQLCITPEMAKRDMPVPDRPAACAPINVRRSGNRMSYEFNCVSGGRKTTGTGETTMSGDSMTNRSDVTVVDHGRTHRIQSVSEMRYLQSDCGNVKPMAAAGRP
ncbi:MAG: DUF3617 domain-containing protein [Burkholderiales bacterium]|nr:DUF3617 family protein [Burkholderiales bacterium]MDE1927318.1 DUF3617 domain-containing protein [Burkholderiales bacterium]MDE2158820.1 DUF3617 domain-containing protein [Burkholderiales bacterium]MDE2503026.1 DUF3617 domain-containing protein [Burkholderiales bacterium]